MMSARWRTRLALATLVLAAAALRLPGVGWGLPDATHPLYSYHPDEAYLLEWAAQLARGEIIPRHFIFGGTLYYSILNVYALAAAYFEPVLGGFNVLADTMLLGRYVSITFGLMTVVLTYHVGRLLFTPPVGWIAALVLAVAPAHVFLAQNVRPDQVATLTALLIVHVAALLWKADPGRDTRLVVWAGILLGAALALRFPLAVFGAAPLAALVLRDRVLPPPSRTFAWLQRGTIVAVTVLVTYVLASPHTLLHPVSFINGLRVTWSYESGIFVDAVGRGPGFYQYGGRMLRDALGDGLHLLTLAGVGYALALRRPPELIILTAVLGYFALLSIASWVVVRYTLPLLPLFALLAAALIVDGFRHPRLRAAIVLLAPAAFLWTVFADLAFLRVQAASNNRDAVSQWIAATLPHVGITTLHEYADDYYFNPVIPQGFAHRVLRITPHTEAAIATLTAPGASQFLVVNEREYLGLERLRDEHPRPEYLALLRLLESERFEQLVEFKQPVRALGIDFSARFTSQDYAVINPGIRVYYRRPEAASP